MWYAQGLQETCPGRVHQVQTVQEGCLNLTLSLLLTYQLDTLTEQASLYSIVTLYSNFIHVPLHYTKSSLGM